MQRPTAAIASLAGGVKARALVASEDGKVGVYTVGGLATVDPAAPEDIARACEVQVGRNPTCLAYQKGGASTFLAVSRGDREIAWIKHTEKDASVIRRLRDARLADPVFAEVSDTHGIQTPLVTVADFKGRKVLNYRYGTLVFATQGGAKFGMGPDGQDEFECGGLLEFPGSPFCISATNVNRYLRTRGGSGDPPRKSQDGNAPSPPPPLPRWGEGRTLNTRARVNCFKSSSPRERRRRCRGFA